LSSLKFDGDPLTSNSVANGISLNIAVKDFDLLELPMQRLGYKAKRRLLLTSFPINVGATERWEGNGGIAPAMPEDGFPS
jgi:hypothetical protein